MNNLSPYAAQREERKSLAAYEERVAAGLVKARAAVEVAKNAIREAVMDTKDADHLVNNELTNVQATARRSRAFLLNEERAALLETIMQAVDDHYFLPLNLMSEESNEQ
jgi:hypothetical protein